MRSHELHYCANCDHALTPEEAEKDITVKTHYGRLYFCSEECHDELGDATSVYPEDCASYGISVDHYAWKAEVR